MDIAVVDIGDQCCRMSDENIHVSLNSKRIASSMLQETACGNMACPLIIQAQPGQQINISTYNINITSSGMYSYRMIYTNVFYPFINWQIDKEG